MTLYQTPHEMERLLKDIDRLIAEMVTLRGRVAAIHIRDEQSSRSTREAAYFGMWADRKDMQGRTSREWLESTRQQQWSRS